MNNRITTLTIILLGTLWAVVPSSALAPNAARHPVIGGPPVQDDITIPRLLSYQGKLLDSTGIPVPDTLYPVRFSLYSQPTGGTQFWTENQDVRTEAGLFSVLLGSVTPITYLPEDGNLYLGMKVGPDVEMTPRTRVVSAAYCYFAGTAEELEGKTIDSFDIRYVNESQASSVSGTMLQPDAVTADKVLDGTILRADVAPGFKAPDADSCDYARYAPAAVDSARVAGNAYRLEGNTVADLDPRWVNESQANSVTNSMIQADAVTSSHIADGTIADADVSGSAAISDHKLAGTGDLVTNLNADQLDGENAAAFVRTSGDSIAGSLAIQNELVVGNKARLGSGCSNAGSYAFAAGYGNNASGPYSTICGGENNWASGARSIIAGGTGNAASANFSIVGGGTNNTANTSGAVVAGGYYNTAGATYAVVPGGYADTCEAYAGIAAGYRVRARSTANYTLAFGRDFVTSTPYAVVFYHSGFTTKLGVGVTNPTHNIDVAGGAYCDGTNWVNASSRALKKDIVALSAEEYRQILDELAGTDVVRFRYKSDDRSRTHIGLVSEDAPEAVATPERDGISTGDAIGFLFAALKAQQAEIEALRARLDAGK